MDYYPSYNRRVFKIYFTTGGFSTLQNGFVSKFARNVYCGFVILFMVTSSWVGATQFLKVKDGGWGEGEGSSLSWVNSFVMWLTFDFRDLISEIKLYFRGLLSSWPTFAIDSFFDILVTGLTCLSSNWLTFVTCFQDSLFLLTFLPYLHDSQLTYFFVTYVPSWFSSAIDLLSGLTNFRELISYFICFSRLTFAHSFYNSFVAPKDKAELVQVPQNQIIIFVL